MILTVGLCIVIMRSKMKVENQYIGPIFKLCIGSILPQQRWQRWQRWQRHSHRWTARTRTQRTHWRTTQRPSASRSESRLTWGSEGECFSSFPHFLISSSLCFSSFPYFLIIVPFLISLFSHHRTFSSTTSHQFLIITLFFTQSSNIHLFLHSRSFFQIPVESANFTLIIHGVWNEQFLWSVPIWEFPFRPKKN